MIDTTRFKNRHHAGALLAERLSVYANRSDTVVLALPRGGVPVGFEIAQALHLPLDVFLVRKVGLPGREEYAIGAITADGQHIVYTDIAEQFGISAETITQLLRTKLSELSQREKLYQSSRVPMQLSGKVVILVDDGLATGLTMLAAIQALRGGSAKPARIIVAVPVAPNDSIQIIEQETDELVCLSLPKQFSAVSLWYDNFTQVSDEEVLQLLKLAAHSYELHLKEEKAAQSQSAQAGNSDLTS